MRGESASSQLSSTSTASPGRRAELPPPRPCPRPAQFLGCKASCALIHSQTWEPGGHRAAAADCLWGPGSPRGPLREAGWVSRHSHGAPSRAPGRRRAGCRKRMWPSCVSAALEPALGLSGLRCNWPTAASVWVPRCPSGKILLPREQPVPPGRQPPEHEGFRTSEVAIPRSRCGPRAPH